jgi:hypothetical protein
LKKNKETNTTSGKKINSKQAVALAGVILLVLLYLITLVAAVTDSSTSAAWFRLCLCATVVLPLLLWIYTWMYSRLTGNSAIGDPKKELQEESGQSGSHPAEGPRTDI